MPIQAISNSIYEVGANDPERQLYASFVALPNGTSYNAYLVTGNDKMALVGTVIREKYERLRSNLQDASVSSLDYVVLLSAQEDLLQILPELIRRFGAKIVCSADLQALVLELVDLSPSDFRLVADHEEIDLGGLHLAYHTAAYADHKDCTATLVEEKFLFSGSIYSSHFADDNVFSKHSSDEIMEAKRYYASCLMPHRLGCQAYTERLLHESIKVIAPMHGPVWQDPYFILSLYRHWTSDLVTPHVVIAYVSTYGHTKKLVEALMFALVRRGLSVIVRDIAEKAFSMIEQSGEILCDLVHSAAFILASSTSEGVAHPAAGYLALLVNMQKPHCAYYGVAGSKVGESRMPKDLSELLQLKSSEQLSDLLIEGKLDAHESLEIENYAAALADKIHRLPNLSTKNSLQDVLNR